MVKKKDKKKKKKGSVEKERLAEFESLIEEGAVPAENQKVSNYIGLVKI